ncbi:hypothetical protein ACTNBL_03030 [Enterococcus villorum]|uniref:Uncharacterized protein n=2 Tax=Enterococcus villorum TaxID=112904 RepID=A0A511IYM5_9ENTE|nr:hypothetical protein [Enterococcus villorum]EOH89916.1 hypothetical protein UAO_01160 [Enterococcus villorum ATCC 700913]EOW78148.1 hypothetical protein I591_01003 [Enterococcus villorum ATCC 700913]GEL90861.1 hypothetical protein EVI01_01980 [Enterococcus villorum]
MERFIHKKRDPNEIPIIFVRDARGNTPFKVSVNEWTNRYSPLSLNELEIKLYRQALAYYSEKDYSKAIDLLKYLISQTSYTHFEYIERLATIYQIIDEPIKELQLLNSALSVAELISLPSALIKKLEKRRTHVKEKLYSNW